MAKLLFDESPLVVQPTLAKAIGLNEAIVLQQINYWMNQKGVGRTIKGERWIYNTVAEWQANFPFWSEETIKRAIYTLQDARLIKTGNYNQSPMDRTKWYTINFETVALLEALIAQEKELAAEAVNDATGQNDMMDISECYDIPESTTEIKKEEEGLTPPKMELPPEKPNVYAAYNQAFGEPIGNFNSTSNKNSIEDLEEYPRAWIDEAFLRTSKRERASQERWKDYRRMPYALSLLNEWRKAKSILPESVSPPAKPTYQRSAAPQSNKPVWQPPTEAEAAARVAQIQAQRAARQAGSP